MTPVQSDHTRQLVFSICAPARVPANSAFVPIRRIGGRRGWYFATWLWRLRGNLDRLFGGKGMGDGRRDPNQVQTGDALDFWRVEAVEPDRRLRLAAEMKLPGRAWLEFEVVPQGPKSLIKQTAIFAPRGLAGLLYWYGLYPVHRIIFAGLLRRIVRLAETAAAEEIPSGPA